MAKHKQPAALARYWAGRSHARAPAPIVVRTTKVVKAKPKHRRHHRHGGGVSSIFSKDRMMTVGAGFAVGALEKMTFVQNLPSLPFLGKTGTLGVAALLFSDGGRNKTADDIATAALTIAGYMMGSTGSIVGDGGYPQGVDGYVAGF